VRIEMVLPAASYRGAAQCQNRAREHRWVRCGPAGLPRRILTPRPGSRL
jgi:hypothetical protein